MSSLFNQASLVVEPAVYETSKVYATKPFDGSGDLTFTRSNDTATRVGPDGLIQKVRTNVLLQSNSFDTTWTNVASTETSGQAGYDGTNNAWLLQLTAATGRIVQSSSTSGLQTFSVYAKAGTLNFIRLFSSAGTSVDAYFDLSNGTYAGSVGGAIVATSIVSVGGGWYRCSFSYNTTITDVRIYPAVAFNDLSATSGNILIQDAMLEVGDVMTDYIATTTAAVSVGPVANVPRLDYLNSSCPRLLLEPQQTNVLTFSEGNLSTYTTNSNVTDAASSFNTFANAIQFGDNSVSRVAYKRNFTPTIGTQYALSVFIQMDDNSVPSLGLTNSTGDFSLIIGGAVATLNTGVQQIGTTNVYRASGVYTASSTNTQFGVIKYTTQSVKGFRITGIQLEAGAYATSYIPTLGAAVTRGADVVQKTSISSLIGQTEGVVFIDYTVTQATNSNSEFSISTGSNANAIRLRQSSGNFLQGVVQNGGVTQASIITSFSIVIGQRYKIAFAYANNDFAMYVNGELIGVDGSGSVPACSQIQNTNGGASGSTDLAGAINQVILFPTRLSNADLAALTA